MLLHKLNNRFCYFSAECFIVKSLINCIFHGYLNSEILIVLHSLRIGSMVTYSSSLPSTHRYICACSSSCSITNVINYLFLLKQIESQLNSVREYKPQACYLEWIDDKMQQPLANADDMRISFVPHSSANGSYKER